MKLILRKFKDCFIIILLSIDKIKLRKSNIFLSYTISVFMSFTVDRKYNTQDLKHIRCVICASYSSISSETKWMEKM